MFPLIFRSLLLGPTPFIRMTSCRTSVRQKIRHQVLKQDRKFTHCGSQRGNKLPVRRSTINLRAFSTSPKRDAWPLAAMLVKLAGPVSKLTKLGAVVGGRTFRNWWKKLPAQHKEKYVDKGILMLNKERLIIIIGGMSGICIAFYFFHLEETPYTHRTRFMPITHAQMNELAVTEHKEILEQYAECILPVNHPDHIRVFRVAQNLIRANKSKEMDHLKWQVNVVFADDQINAFVLPHGQIFVFTGMLNMFSNDHELATVLGHEMAHAVLQHGAEQVALHGFINLFLIVSLATLWALLPTDLLAIGAQWVQNRILSILLHLPYSRKLELEADKVGMYFAAKACFDVRECPKFWSRIALGKNMAEEEDVDIEWLSTHPSHRSRAQKLKEMVPEAMELRRLCNCPQLDAIPKLSGRPRPRPLTLTRLAGVDRLAVK